MPQRAAEEVTQPPDAADEELKIRRDIAVQLLEVLYIEVYAYAGLRPNKEAEAEVQSGKAQYFLLGPDRIQQQFDMIERFIEESIGATHDEKIAALFNKRKVYGELAKDLYVATLDVFQRARTQENELRVAHISDGRKLQALLRARKPSRKQRRWLEKLRRDL